MKAKIITYTSGVTAGTGTGAVIPFNVEEAAQKLGQYVTVVEILQSENTPQSRAMNIAVGRALSKLGHQTHTVKHRGQVCRVWKLDGGQGVFDVNEAKKALDRYPATLERYPAQPI